VKLWLVGTDTAKHALSARLTGDANVEAAARQIRFSNALPLEYYEQLTAEAFDPEHNKWVKRRGRRNEGMDTWVYGTAAAQHPELRVHAMRPVDWSRLEALLEPATAQDTPEIPKHTDVSRDSTNTSRKQAAPKRGGFTTRWRQ
jgi:phage terminase large subunit GpA-like protein